MSRIRKVVITAFGDESKLAIQEADLKDPGAGEVQLTVEYSVVSGSDVNMRHGTYPFQRKAPLTPGYSVIGTVRANGRGCAKFKVGDRVACLSKYDGQAELINLPERFLVPVPEGVDLHQAVGLVLDWVTAYELLHQAGRCCGWPGLPVRRCMARRPWPSTTSFGRWAQRRWTMPTRIGSAR